MMRSDGFLGDVGPLSFYNVMRAFTILAGILLLWALTPWFPWK